MVFTKRENQPSWKTKFKADDFIDVMRSNSGQKVFLIFLVKKKDRD